MVDKRVLINFSEQQYDAVAKAAHKSALPFSSFVRMASYMEATKAGVEVAKPEAEIAIDYVEAEVEAEFIAMDYIE